MVIARTSRYQPVSLLEDVNVHRHFPCGTWIKKIATPECFQIARHLAEGHPTMEGESSARRSAGIGLPSSARPILALKLYHLCSPLEPLGARWDQRTRVGCGSEKRTSRSYLLRSIA
jgi:hypothetical protein